MYGWMNDFRSYPEYRLALAIFTNHWPISQSRYHEADLISEFIVDWLDRERAGRAVALEARSWAWKTGYVMGLTIGEQLKPAMGVEQPVTPDMVERMASGALPRDSARPLAQDYDPAGFRLGLADVLGVVPQTYQAIRAFYASDRLRVLPQELALIYREMGLSGSGDNR